MSKIYVEIENEFGEMARYKHHSNGRGFISATSVVHPTAFVESSAYVEPDAQLGPGAWVGAGSWIDRGAIIGAGVFIGANVHVGQEARIGRGAKIGSHTRIGDRAVITDGMHVAHDTTIVDGELVTRSAERNAVLSASPADTVQRSEELLARRTERASTRLGSADAGFAKAA
ncbi:MAG: transferase [Subtercola sp.]|nr:transferase [Subtercola sp.]